MVTFFVDGFLEGRDVPRREQMRFAKKERTTARTIVDELTTSPQTSALTLDTL